MTFFHYHRELADIKVYVTRKIFSPLRLVNINNPCVAQFLKM